MVRGSFFVLRDVLQRSEYAGFDQGISSATKAAAVCTARTAASMSYKRRMAAASRRRASSWFMAQALPLELLPRTDMLTRMQPSSHMEPQHRGIGARERWWPNRRLLSLLELASGRRPPTT